MVGPGSAAGGLLAAAAACMPAGGVWCGLEHGRCRPAYRPDGRVEHTESLGLWECCSACSGDRCRANREVLADRGVRLPLEVFRTRTKGWGVRCAREVLGGEVVCCYEGELITHSEAVRCRSWRVE